MIERTNKTSPFFRDVIPMFVGRVGALAVGKRPFLRRVCPAINIRAHSRQLRRFSTLWGYGRNLIFLARDLGGLIASEIGVACSNFSFFGCAHKIKTIIALTAHKRVLHRHFWNSLHSLPLRKLEVARHLQFISVNCRASNPLSPSAGMNLRRLRLSAYPSCGMVAV